jgi:peptidoglycan/xylan/chitin deacetylase (PgdA/CDA1 family)
VDQLICALFSFIIACSPGSPGSPTPAPATAPAIPVAATPTAAPTATAAPPTAVPPTATPTPAQRQLKLPPPEGAPEIVSGPRGSTLVAMTFDGGAGARNTPPILDALKAANLKVTMFLTGQWAQQNPELVKRMAEEGHEFANHSWSHPEFTKLGSPAMVSEMQRTEDLVVQLTGKSTKPWFRPPFGNRDARVLGVIGSQGYYSVQWTLDSGDWRTDYSAADVLNIVSTRTAGGSIVVNHLDSWQTAQTLPQSIQRLQARGFKIVTLSEMFSE